MEIRTNSWHYRVYEWSYTWLPNGHVPQSTNLCAYVRRLIFGVPFHAFGFGVAALIFGVISLFALPFGYYIRIPWTNNVYREIGEFDGLRIGSFRLMPWHVLLPMLVALIGYADYGVIKSHNYFNTWFVLECVALVGGIVIASVIWYSKSDTPKLARDYVDAKTQGICPLITFKN